MKKSKLIEMLNSLPGDPDVLLWNGWVDDWQDLSLVQGALTRMTFDAYCRSIRYERIFATGDILYQIPDEEIPELKKCYKKHIAWEDNQCVTPEDIESKRYQVKTVVFLDAKTRGKKAQDRLGTIEF